MRRHSGFTVVILLAVSIAANAAPRAIERAMETSTAAVQLPAKVPATIDARGCMQCPSMRMEVPQTARFYVGNTEVSFNELREFVAGKSYDMVIFYELNDTVVRRIVVSAVMPKRIDGRR